MEKAKRKSKVPAVRKGFHTVTPYLIVDGAMRLVEFMKTAFNAEVQFMSKSEEDRVLHAFVQIGNSVIMISDTMEGMPARTSMLYLYVKDTDATFRKAVAAGGKVIKEPEDQFYGDRAGGVTDEWGNSWWIGTQIEVLSDEELDVRTKESMKQQAEA